MHKVIKGKMIEISDTEVFELALEGVQVRKKLNTMNSIYTPIVWKTVDFYVSMYKMYYRLLPYPLSDIESDIKYTTIGNALTDIIKTSSKNIRILEGLHVDIEGADIEIWFVGDKYVLQHKSDKGILDDLRSFKNDKTYCMFEWFAEYVQGLDISERDCREKFYSKFYNDIFSVCNSNAEEIEKELRGLLDITNIGKLQCQRIRDNHIVDLDDGRDLIMDLYFSSQCKTGETETVITMDKTVKDKDIFINTYRYKAYSKEVDRELEEIKLIGLNYVFNRLCGIRNRDNSEVFQDFKGILIDRKIVYEMDKHLYMCKAYRVCEDKEISSNAELLGYLNGEVYYKVTGTDKGITRVAVYKYAIGNETTTLCGIQFIGGDVTSV